VPVRGGKDARELSHRTRLLWRWIVCLTSVAALPATAFARGPAQPAGLVTIPGTIAPAVAAQARLEPTPPAQLIELMFVLRSANAPALEALASAVTDPASADYGHYLSAQQFATQFGPLLPTWRR
jgi:kumamolisin